MKLQNLKRIIKEELSKLKRSQQRYGRVNEYGQLNESYTCEEYAADNCEGFSTNDGQPTPNAAGCCYTCNGGLGGCISCADFNVDPRGGGDRAPSGFEIG